MRSTSQPVRFERADAVSANVLVRLVVFAPEHLVRRHCHQQRSAWSRDARELGQRALVVWQVLQDVEARAHGEGRVRERQVRQRGDRRVVAARAGERDRLRVWIDSRRGPELAQQVEHLPGSATGVEKPRRRRQIERFELGAEDVPSPAVPPVGVGGGQHRVAFLLPHTRMVSPFSFKPAKLRLGSR
jgi:hypothetical protein